MSLRSTVRRGIGVWLMADGIATGLWFTGLADSLSTRDTVSMTAMILRVLVAALSVSGGWFLSQRRPAGPPLAMAAATLLAIFSLISAGTGVLPSNLDPSFRWSVAWLQTIGAAATILFLRGEAREKS